MYAHEALAVFSLVRRGTCQQLTNGRRSPVLALHVDRVYRRVPRFLPLSIDRSTIVPFYRRGKTKNETRRASFVEERSGSIIRVYYIRYSLTFSRQFNQLYRSLFSERNGMVFPFDENVSVFSRSTISLSLTPPFCPRDSPTSAFSRATRALFLYLLSRLTTRLPAPPHHASSPPLFQPPVSRLEDLE